MQRDEVYLIDMWRILLREWRWFMAVLIVVLAATFTFLRVTKPQWQADAWIQIGQVGFVPAGQDPKAEPFARVMERVKLIPFQNETLESIGIGSRTPEGALYRHSLKIEPLPYAGPLIKLSVRAHSPEMARKLAEATVERLRDIHRSTEATQLNFARAHLAEVLTDLQQTTAERDHLQQVATQSKDNFAGVLLTSKNDEVRSLQQARADLEARLSTTYTYDTSLMWPVYVSEDPVFPNHLLMWGMGGVLGVFLGTLAAVRRNALRRRAAVSAATSRIAAKELS
ncbi:Wzz/FepE/Etk N-terminal domain-containing protein [Dyella acidisoli]|uniref:Chain-length determining protein n=1 Tax=Dyella acidisoli TaxID=1867834 RepID=A0ABQ5XYE0_9GAMM|nr:Wzz/FepE/Etk N-terminal domain-containing protein [Dyella acidisoli]GLQ95541.1 chain-length determining protein [Dyella acidisoli]